MDRTRQIVKDNLARIKLIGVSGSVFCDSKQKQRLLSLLYSRKKANSDVPLLMVAVHRDIEESMMETFRSVGPLNNLANVKVVRQADHNETVGNVLKLYRTEIDPTVADFDIKRQCLFLSRRGGGGKPNFISPFTGGGGTTCGAWTHVVKHKPDGTIQKGFMKASLAVGFCPVECPYCYLQMTYTEGMDIALNWEDLADELRTRYRGYPHPINFGETSGLVEYDEWFCNGLNMAGSMVQFVIDACAAADVTPFFLTKIRYPSYLRFKGRVQVGISLMPEPIREWLAPHGSPSDELLSSLRWAVGRGAIDPVVRMTVLWQQRDLYAKLLSKCRSALGKSGWRITLDILRFTPNTARTIHARHPDAAARLAREMDPEGKMTLQELAKAGHDEKKIRPPQDRQVEIYKWFRDELNRLGCHEVQITACKGDPTELLPLARDKTIRAMPCACYNVTPVEKKPGVIAELPVISM